METYLLQNIIMLKSILHSQYSKILYIGIFIFLIGSLFNSYQLINQNNSYNDIQNPLLSKLTDLNIFFSLFYLIIVAPVIEEIIFRTWVLGKKISYLFSLFGITIFSYFINGSILTSSSIFLVLIISFFLIETKLIIALSTSTIFAFLHIANIGDNFHTLTLLPLLGTSMVFTFVALHYNLKFSILTHAVYNTIALSFFIFIPSDSDKKILFENNTYIAEIEGLMALSRLNNVNLISNDSISIVKSLPEIIPELSGFNNEVFYESKISSLKKHRLTVKSKSHLKICKDVLIQDIMALPIVTADTNIIDAYILHYNNATVTTQENDIYYVKLYDFINFLKFKKGISIKLSSKYENKKIAVSQNFLRTKEEEEIIRLLNNEPYFNTSPSKVGKMFQITLYQTKP